MKTILGLLITACSLFGQTPTWSTVAHGAGPNVNGWFNLQYDPVAHCALVYASDNTSIYSNSLYCLTTTGTVTRIFTTGTSGDNCIADTPSLPGDRHPVSQVAVDTKRNWLWIWGGVCNAVVRNDLYYVTLTASPASDTVTKVTATLPSTIDLEAILVYDPDHDALIAFGPNAGGHPQTWAFCYTKDNPTPGTRTAAQLQTGCGADTFVQLSTTGTGPDTAYFPSGVYDTTNHKLIEFGASAGTATWAYDPATKTWTNMAPATHPPVNTTTMQGTHGMAFVPSSGLVYLHAPNAQHDWTYNYATNTWTDLGFTGGESKGDTMTYVASANSLVTWNYATGNASNSMKVGVLGSPTAPTITSSSSLPSATYGTAYSQTLAASGTTPITWSVTAGALPAGLSLSSAGVISGTPTVAGSYSVTIQAANGTAPNDSKVFSIISGSAAVSIPLTVSEALYPGGSTGVDRSSEPFTVGVPVAATPCIANTGALGLTGASGAQFRILGTWDGTCAKWILVDGILTSLSAGGTATVTLTANGSGNTGTGMATDGSTIVVNTNGGACGSGSAICFDIRKASHNGIDQVRIGSTTVVSAGTSTGLLLNGPDPAGVYPANVTCLPTSGGSTCDNVYTSANDSSSTCGIEENGPVKVAVKCTGALKTSTGAAYMNYTVRYYFYKGKPYVKVTPTLRNADYGISNTAATAFRGHQGVEFRFTPNLAGTLNYTISTATTGTGCSGGVCTGTLDQTGGTDYAYIYQAESNRMKVSSQGWCSGNMGCVLPTSLTGYAILKNGTALATGTASQYPQGWADISDSAGVGVQIGQYQMAAYGDKSLEFRGGGTDVRVGLIAAENNTTSTSTTTANKPYYMAWPQWDIQPDVYLNFHTGNPSSLANDYLKLQHYLVARATDFEYYNTVGMFPSTTAHIIPGATEDAFMTAVGAAANPAIAANKACCIQDYGLTDTFNFPLQVWKFYPWGDSGGGNQTEFRWSRILQFFQRGWTGRYLDSANFYRFQAGSAYPMSDGFTWRSHSSNATQAAAAHCSSGSTTGELSGFGTPQARSANCDLGSRLWHDQEHNHTYGIFDYYFLTGDENINDSLDAILDWTVPVAGRYQSGDNCQSVGGTGDCGLWNARAVGVSFLIDVRDATYLKTIGDTANAANVMAQADSIYNLQIAPVLCLSGYPAGCSYGPSAPNPPWTSIGISRTRGVALQQGENTGGSWCGVSGRNWRRAKPFMEGIMLQGLLEYREYKGSGWPEWWNSLDLAYGVGQWGLNEMFIDSGNGHWSGNGFEYENAPDGNAACNGTGESKPPSANFGITAQQTVSSLFLVHALVNGGTSTWLPKFTLNLQGDMNGLGMGTSDMGSYQIQRMIYAANNPGLNLNTLPLTNFVDNGGGSYTISWTVPPGAQSYRVKWAPTTIVDWIGFNILTNSFIGDPSTTTNWFAATNATGIPGPASEGTTQQMTVATGRTGLTAANFAVKAYSTGGSAQAGTMRPVRSGKSMTGGKIVK